MKSLLSFSFMSLLLLISIVKNIRMFEKHFSCVHDFSALQFRHRRFRQRHFRHSQLSAGHFCTRLFCCRTISVGIFLTMEIRENVRTYLIRFRQNRLFLKNQIFTYVTIRGVARNSGPPREKFEALTSFTVF